ncbi:response regulator [Brumicola nitratireducens]|uniref:Response regulator n=1 Tax=Glaciecola nitratireducens (strain JCM 12485 / KCTC 12276 / FR1064) TaxID=1085623 RepID=G4QJQ0_GLANF|nr:response regulator [Glaciecola nitratireducens]AEP28710.1 response regulator [Glaciecola nitratireducens FR1064]
MTVSVLICDDSGFARKAMARSLPDGWDIDISFAEHGQQAIDMIKEGKGDILFLDLNMPVLDGYQTMQIIRKEDLPTLVIVVSGDVQEEARKRMLALGAVDFIRKPIDNEKLTTILAKYGIYTGATTAQKREQTNLLSENADEAEKLDAFRELANVAMGQAGENLAKILNEFIDLPIPNVSLLHSSELHMALDEVNRNKQMSAVSKGFISTGISGEAIILFNDSNVQSMASLLGDDISNNDGSGEIEVLMDVSNILIGACLNALSEQLNVKFTHNTPIILGLHRDLHELMNDQTSRWEKVLAIEIAYAISKHDISFELLLLIPDQDVDRVFNRLVFQKGSEDE